MSLRFAIIKHVKTHVGQNWEDVVFEYQEDKVYEELLKNLLNVLPEKKWYQKLTKEEVKGCFKKAWRQTVSDFKKVTVSIF